MDLDAKRYGERNRSFAWRTKPFRLLKEETRRSDCDDRHWSGVQTCVPLEDS